LTTPVDVDGLPKAELHCHADGMLDSALLADLVAEGHALPISPDELAPITSREEWLAQAPLFDRALAPVERVLPLVIEHHVRRLRRQNVVHAEVMVSRLLGARATVEETVELFAELRERVERARGDMEVGVLVCVGRSGAERLNRQIERIVPLARARLICGVAVAGDEGACRIRELAGGLRRLRDEGLGIEIHAGETLGPDSVEDALEHGAPHRLGHAVAAFSEPRLIDRLLRDGVHVELCPTSNLRLGVVGRLEDHPLPIAHRSGVSFSINTDDPGPFGCSLTSELALIRDAFGFGVEDFAQVLRNTMDARFARP
jgi:adenosine deaminase